MSTKLKDILTKNGPYPTLLTLAKADPGLALAMSFLTTLQNFAILKLFGDFHFHFHHYES